MLLEKSTFPNQGITSKGMERSLPSSMPVLDKPDLSTSDF